MQQPCNGNLQRHCNGKILDLKSDLTSDQESDRLDLRAGQSILLVFILVRLLVNLQVTNFQLQLVGNYREPEPCNRGELKMKNVIQKMYLFNDVFRSTENRFNTGGGATPIPQYKPLCTI